MSPGSTGAFFILPRSIEKAAMVTTDKNLLKLLTLLFIESLDENTPEYDMASDILLTLMGVSDSEGNLTPEYRDSPMWDGGEDGTPLRPSGYADIAAKLPQELRPYVVDKDNQSDKTAG